MNIEQKLAHRQQLERQRSKRYYDKNKAKILEKRQSERKEFEKKVRDIKEKQKERIKITPAIFEAEPQPIINNTIDYTRDELINLIKQKNYGEGTEKTYISDTNRIYRVTGCETIISCLRHTEKLIDEIKKGTSSKGKIYKVNSLKQTFQFLVTIIDKFLVNNTNIDKKELSIIKNKINAELDRYKELSGNENTKKINTQFVPSFKQYLEEVKEMFKENSKQYLLALLYSIFTVRDNFKAMKIIENEDENNKKNNFILVNGDTIKIFINDFKTKKKYEHLLYTYESENADERELKRLIEIWIASRKLNYGDYIFGKSALSGTISDMNKLLNYDELQGIHMYRHIRVTEEYAENLSFDDRKKLADKMGHSVFTASKYKRNIKVTES